MTRNDLYWAIDEIIDNMEDYEIIDIWNEYCDRNSYDDNRIYYYNELDELCYGMTPIDIIEQYGELNGCTYFKIGVYEAEACDCDDIERDDLIEYIIDNEWSNNNSDIEDVIDEWLESEEEEEKEE